MASKATRATDSGETEIVLQVGSELRISNKGEITLGNPDLEQIDVRTYEREQVLYARRRSGDRDDTEVCALFGFARIETTLRVSTRMSNTQALPASPRPKCSV